MSAVKKCGLSVAVAGVILACSLGVERADAGSVAGFGGSLEITQLVNVSQLAASYVQQVEAVVQQVRQYQNMVQNIRSMDASVAERMLRNELGISSLSEAENVIRVAGRLSTTLEALHGDMSIVANEKRVAADVIQRMRANGYNIGVNDYTLGMRIMAEERQGVYAERYEAFNQAIENSRRNIAVSQQLAQQAPSISGSVEGLAALNLASAQMNTELAQISTLLATTAQMNIEQQERDGRRELDELEEQEARANAARQLLRGW